MCAATAPASTFGLNVHTPDTRVVGEIAGSGVGWVRIDFVWALIEDEQDVLDWRLYDRLIDDLEARGLRIFATLQGTPGWATDGELLIGVPRDTDDWRDFCFRSAWRYRGRVHAWGLWNEPNHVFFDGTRRQYIDDILLAGAASVRAADPDALVCGPELAHLQSGDWDSWLRDVVRETRDELDVVTHHVYPDGASSGSVTEALVEGGRWPWEPSAVAVVLDDAGWDGRPFWLTETGADAYDHGEAAQASFITGLLMDWFRPERTHDWMGRIFFYHVTDDPRITDEWYGLLSAPPELRRRPAYAAYREFIDGAVVDDAELVTAVMPRFARVGRALTVRLEVLNTGTTEWTPEGYRLTTGLEPSGWIVAGGTLREPVPPRGTASFTLYLSHPTGRTLDLPASFTFSARMERIGRWMVGDQLRREIVLTATTPPIFVAHPTPSMVSEGGTIELRVGAVSPSPKEHRWRRNGIELEDGDQLSGTASAALLITGADRHLGGVYDCVVTNEAGSVVSDPATLAVIGAGGEPPRTVERPLADPVVLRALRELRERARHGRHTTR
jgi:hypothetical protein